jgi:hypothetical protein
MRTAVFDLGPLALGLRPLVLGLWSSVLAVVRSGVLITDLPTTDQKAKTEGRRPKTKVQSPAQAYNLLYVLDYHLILFQSEFGQNGVHRFYDLRMRQLARAGNSYLQLSADTSRSVGKH